jgi:hypothetical protein
VVGFLAGFPALWAGCGPEESGNQSISSTAQALSGTPGTFKNCNDLQQGHVTAALTQVRAAMLSPLMLPWLKEKIFDGADYGDRVLNGVWDWPEWATGYPEWIQARMTDSQNTSVNCGGASGFPGGSLKGPEEINLGVTLTTTEPIPSLAGVIAHEVAHTKGFDHPFTPSFSIPETLRGAVEALAGGATSLPAGDRQGLVGEKTLAPVGNATGNQLDYDKICAGTGFAAGIYGYVWTVPTGLGFRCAPVGAAVNSATAMAGGAWGSWAESACSPGLLMIGAQGYAKESLQSIRAICLDPWSILFGFGGSPVVGSPMGLEQDLAWERRCPVGMAVKGMRARSAGYPISRVELICQSLATPESIDLTPPRNGAALVGQYGYWTYLERCAGRQAILGILPSYSSTEIIGLGANCREVRGSGASATTGTLTRIAPQGGQQGGGLLPITYEQNDSCPLGSFLVGLGYNAPPGDKLRGVQAICADYRQWGNLSLPEGPLLQRLPRRGDTGGNWGDMLCQRGQYLNGWWIGSWKGVTGLAGVCRPFSLN